MDNARRAGESQESGNTFLMLILNSTDRNNRNRSIVKRQKHQNNVKQEIINGFERLKVVIIRYAAHRPSRDSSSFSSACALPAAAL